MNLAVTLAPLRKAVVAAAGAGLFALVAGIGTALTDGHLTSNEVGIAFGLGATASAAVGRATFQVKNKPKPRKPVRIHLPSGTEVPPARPARDLRRPQE